MERRTYFLVKCHKCGDFTPFAPYCRHCGCRTDRMEGKVEAVECPHCKKQVAIGTFCSACGKKMEDQ